MFCLGGIVRIHYWDVMQWDPDVFASGNDIMP